MRKPQPSATSLKESLLEQQATIAWYFSIVTWLLNRSSGVPLSILELIRDGNAERLRKFGPAPKEKEKN